MATEGMQTGSPSKPADDAVFPEENAYVTAECGTKEKGESVMKEKEATMQGQIILDNQEKEKEGQITAAMLQEENKMHEETEKEEDRLQKEQEKFWSSLDEEDREKQYVRLKFLLTKSNMYTKYLLQRMEAQREEQEKKMARKRKREEKKKNTENASSTKILSPTTRNTKTALRESGNTSNIPVSEADERLSSTPRNKESKSRKKGKKRKAGEITSDEDTQVKRSKVTENHKEASEGVNLNEVKETEKAVSCSDLPEGESADDRKSTEEEEDVEEEEEDRSHMPKGAPRDQPVLFSGGVLRAYQMEGFHWLRTLYENGVNGILADEMGLGKTIQCIALISHMVNMGVTGPFLVCTPLSTLPNWYSEFTRFAPKVPVVLYHGTKEDRNVKRRRLRSRVMIKPGVSVYPVFITSYEVTMRDRKQLQNYDWKYLIVDEGHRIKNTQCRLIKELKMYRNTHRLLLTGTPLQNNLSELWSLLNFLLPEIFDDMGSFETWFNVESIVSSGAEEKIVKEEQEKNILSMLHQILTPFMLRRLKQDVDLLIPPKKEILVYAPLSERQQEVYTSLVDRTIFNKIEEEKAEAEPEIEYNDQGRPVRRATAKKVDYSIMFPQKQDDRDNSDLEEELESWAQAIAENISTVQQSAPVYKEASERSNLNLRNILMELRKCCNHPYLLETPTLEQMFSISEEIVSSCGKMRLLDCMLKELKDRGHRVLIFSQMTRMLDILEDYCSLRQYSYCRLDGRCRLADRQESIGQFNKDAENFIFLLSTRAGGLGLNLMAADTVIIYDSDWNPQCDLQAQDRCHRIGQTKPVVVYRLVTANTVDQKIVERAAAKRRLEKMVIHKGKFKQGIKNFQETIKPLNSLDLLELLHSKDHEKEIKGLNGKVINKKEMNSLMDRSDMWAMMSKTPGKTTSKDSTKKRSAGAKEVDGVFKVIDEECCGKVPTSVDS